MAKEDVYNLFFSNVEQIINKIDKFIRRVIIFTFVLSNSNTHNVFDFVAFF